MYREDHTTDCWINLLRLPIITIVTSSLYNNIFFYATRPGIKGRESKNLQCEGIWYQCWDFVIFRFSFCQAFIALFFSRCFYLFISLFKKIKKSKNNINPQMYKGEEGWVCHRHRPLRFFWVFSQRPKHQHLMFSVAVRSSIHHSFARILSRVQWWSVSMVTGYNVISRRWSSHFWVKVHVFSSFFFFSNKSKSSG